MPPVGGAARMAFTPVAPQPPGPETMRTFLQPKMPAAWEQPFLGPCSQAGTPPIVPRRTMATLFGREGELMKGVFLRMLEGFVAPACGR